MPPEWAPSVFVPLTCLFLPAYGMAAGFLYIEVRERPPTRRSSMGSFFDRVVSCEEGGKRNAGAKRSVLCCGHSSHASGISHVAQKEAPK